jgi:hypothetical protein
MIIGEYMKRTNPRASMKGFGRLDEGSGASSDDSTSDAPMAFCTAAVIAAGAAALV